MRSRRFIVRNVGNKTRLHPRFAVVVSKKIFKSAVKRNRIRRRVFEIVRSDLGQFDRPIDSVITIVSPDVITAPHDELVDELKGLLTNRPPGF